jgi:hypothetical protein
VHVEKVANRVSTETPAEAARKEDVPGLATALGEPYAEDGRRLLCQRGTPILAPLAQATDIRTCAKVNVRASEVDQLRETKACLDRQHEERMITAADES